MRRPAFIAVSLTALTVAAVPSSTSAATQLGETFAPTNNCITHITFVQEFAINGNYTAPFAGVITSWSHQAPAVPGEIRFKVYRAAGGNNYTAVGETGFEHPVAGQVNTYPARITVAAGDLLGLSTGSVSNPCTRNASNHQIGFNGGFDPAPGMTVFMTPDATDRKLDIAAVLEPDADGDGFGDETQDCAPTDASRHDDCTPPETQITKRPKDRTRKKKATFEFISIEPNSSFECSVDGAAFATCASPDTFKVKKGKHHFEVRGVDAAGNVDASPASDDWKVKKKKKKKKKK
ncbi:MAG TPA: hypothetical protein VEK39_12700 [Solirubrobacterales bacterium]|nr:hypothetical protein [Solirubrobacterales bacterium]